MHSFLSASNGSWLNYDEDKLIHVFHTKSAAQRGTDLHALAAELIRLNVRLPDNETTMSLYVNDCIGYRMTPEQTLFVSPHAFGTPDAIGLRKKILRISDLKTGLQAAHERQLEIYAAYFCLEYGFEPFEFEGMELRIYQNDDIKVYDAEAVQIKYIMDKIIRFDKIITQLREENE